MMSWLFDRLCELAAADRVEVIVAADMLEPVRSDDSTDLAELLLRASQVPQLTIWLLAERREPHSPPVHYESVDLDVLTDECARLAIQRLLGAHQCSSDSALQIESDTVALVSNVRAHRALTDPTAHDHADVRMLFATDQAGHTEVFGQLARRGLGIAIGGVDPQAAVKVPDMMGTISILDALVALRSFAFGVRARDAQIAASVARVCSS